jgi:uncharacterized protein
MIVVSVLALLAGSVAAQVASTPPSEVRTAATVQRMVRPDFATVTLGIAADGVTPARAASRLASRVDSLRRALETLGIPRDSVVNRSRWYWWSGRIEILPEPARYVPRASPAPDGRLRDMVQDTTYRAHDALEVRIHDVARLGAILDTVMGRGISDISNVKFSATDVSAVEQDAMREATVRARRQAEAIAAAGNLQLGRALLLSTQGDNTARYSGYDFTVDGAVLARGISQTSPTVVVQPSLPVSVTVSGRWELIAKP